MNRLMDFGYCGLIETAISCLPLRLQQWSETIHFLTGTDPVFAGLHPYEEIGDGRSYRNECHCVYRHNQKGLPRTQRHTTIVLPPKPNKVSIHTIVHELGHALHQEVGLGIHLEVTTEYSLVDHYEAFAEAFTLWYLPPIEPWRTWMGSAAPKATQLFEDISHG